jgi:gas vesicle structural protein
VNRLNLAESGGSKGLPDLVGNAQESGAKKKVKGAARGALESAGESVRDFLQGDDEEVARSGDGRSDRHRSRPRQREED